jgi:hypothetical protein
VRADALWGAALYHGLSSRGSAGALGSEGFLNGRVAPSVYWAHRSVIFVTAIIA